MLKYIFQLRRGWKWDSDPETGLPRDDWAEYDALPDGQRIDPLEGELVLEYDNGVPRLKIGNGKDKFGALPYMSVDSFVLPKQPKTINLPSNAWTGINGKYAQDITKQLTGLITVNSKIDLQPTPEQLRLFLDRDVAFTIINEDGTISAHAIGTKPVDNYVGIPITITEVVC